MRITGIPRFAFRYIIAVRRDRCQAISLNRFYSIKLHTCSHTPIEMNKHNLHHDFIFLGLWIVAESHQSNFQVYRREIEHPLGNKRKSLL